MSQEEKDLVSLEVASMLEKGAICVVNPNPDQFLSNIFLRRKKDGSNRPIINLKGLNNHIKYEKFKMETLKDLKHLLRQGDLMVKIDLKDAYFSVPLAKSSRKYVRFPWEGNLYEFLCLTFGLGPGPRLFTKLLKIPIGFLRKLKIRLIIYIDDILIMGADLAEILMARDSVLAVLQSLGFIINLKKSVLVPSSTMEFLGFLANSVDMTLTLPEEKAKSLVTLCSDTLRSERLTLRELARVIGKLKATAPAFTHAPLQTRYLQQILVKAVSQGRPYAFQVHLDEKARLELQWWSSNITIQKGKPLSLEPPQLVISTDGAKTGGWGAECNGQGTGGPWTWEEDSYHINEQEMVAARNGLMTFTKITRASRVHLLVDNPAAISYIEKMGGTKNSRMLEIAKEIWSYLMSKKITLTVEYIPSELNVIADWESRNWTDSSEWKLDPYCFLKICNVFGTPDIDLFASRTSHQLPVYMSWRPDPGCLAVNALQQTWTHRALYAFPPFCLVGQCLRKVQADRARLTIITPLWTSQSWFPTLLGMSVANPLLLPASKGLLTGPKGETHPLLANKTLQLLAWRVSWDTREQASFQKQCPLLSAEPEQSLLERVTARAGRNSAVGVVNDRLILLHVL